MNPEDSNDRGVRKTPKTGLYMQVPKDQIHARSKALLQDPESVNKQVSAILDDENFPGHVAVREWTVENNANLSNDEHRQLSTFLSSAAKLGKISQGQKIVRVYTKRRSQWFPTYLPEVIAAACEKMFPERLIED